MKRKIYFGLILFLSICSQSSSQTTCKQAYQDCIKACNQQYPPPPLNGINWDALLCMLGCEGTYYQCVNDSILNSTYVPEYDTAVYYYSSPPVQRVLKAGRRNGNNWLAGQGNVTGVNFYAVRLEDFIAAPNINAVNWIPIGQGVFNSSNNFWETQWNIPSLSNTVGFQLKAEFFDAGMPGGKMDVPGLAFDQNQIVAIPTLSEWGLIIFGILMLGFGVFYLLRRKRNLAI